jgi:acetyltransferase-like isoleucine patch superfamily enzyme
MVKKLKYLYKLFFWSTERYARSQGVKIGVNCDIQKVYFGSEPYLIEIGDHVQLTNGTKIFTHGGAWIFRQKNPDFDYFGKVTIKNNVYVGNNVLIMPGVTIGNNVLIGAGSVVSKSVPDGKIVAGNPAKILGETVSYYEKIIQFNVGTKKLNFEDKKAFLLSLDDNFFIKK